MEKKSEKTPDAADVKQQIETIAGHEVDAEALINLFFPSGTYDFTDGNAVWTSIFRPGKTCNAATLLDVGGVSSTKANGQRVFLLSDFVCLPLVRAFSEPINVLATARAASPFFLTATHALINNNADLQITIFAWDPQGAAAPNVTFDWRCRLVSVPIIL